ncbi:MAG: alpha/beta hydrolase [Planctomycetia bacterium]|nr:alpha/beta hydrolase [Planctomycetia bacterium]
MFETLKKLKYGARVLLARGGGQPETIDVAGRSTVIIHGGDGPPFVYLHSTLGEAFMWFPFYQTWAKQFKVYAPTHPGFGASAGFDRIDTVEDMAFHYVELFDALGLEQVNLGGVSLGGWIAAEFAVRWPERVRKLWIAGAPGLWVEEEPLPDMFRYMREPAKLRELCFHEPNSAMARTIFPDDADDERRMKGYQALTVLARLVWDRPYNPKLAERLRRVQCPVLLVWGDKDRLVPPSYGEAYRKHLPQAEMKRIPNCGHLLMFEREKEFVEIVANFCK